MKLICPICKRPMLSAAERCSGSFLDENHPPNVAPVAAQGRVDKHGHR